MSSTPGTTRRRTGATLRTVGVRSLSLLRHRGAIRPRALPIRRRGPLRFGPRGASEPDGATPAVATSARPPAPAPAPALAERPVGHDARLIGLDRARWGARLTGLSVLAAAPSLEVHHDVLVVPEHRELYDASGRLIPASVRPVGARRQAPTFMVPERIAVPRRTVRVDGHLLYAGTLHQEFGHFLVEGVGRLWPLLADRGTGPAGPLDGVLCDRDDPRVAAAFRGPVLAPLAGRLPLRFAAAPTRITRVTVPGSSWPYWGSVHAVHAAVTGVATDGRPAAATTQPLYLTRELLPPHLRSAPQEATLTAELRRRGVRVVSPERLTARAQLALVQQHRTVVGMVGSALHAVLLAPGPDRRTVHLCDVDEPVFPSFPTQDALLGATGVYVGCTRADPTSPKGGADRDVMLDVDAALEGLRGLGLLDG